MKRLNLKHYLILSAIVVVLVVLMLTEDGYLVLDGANMGRPDLWFLLLVFVPACYFLGFYGWERWREHSTQFVSNAFTASVHHEEPFKVVTPPAEWVAHVRESLKGARLTEAECDALELRLGPHAIYLGFGVQLARVKGDGEGYVWVVPLPLVGKRGAYVDCMVRLREFSGQEHVALEPWVLDACLRNVPRFKVLYSSVFYGYEPDSDVVLVDGIYTRTCDVPQVDTAAREEWLNRLLMEVETRLDAAKGELEGLERRLMARTPTAQPAAQAPPPEQPRQQYRDESGRREQ